MGLGAATEHMIGKKPEKPLKGVSICPGPNMAYFSKIMSLKEITDHIYGRIDMISNKTRPHMFLKELKLYVDHLKNKIDETQGELNKRQEKYLLTFTENMKEGIDYYQQLFIKAKDQFKTSGASVLNDLQNYTIHLEYLENKIKGSSKIN